MSRDDSERFDQWRNDQEVKRYENDLLICEQLQNSGNHDKCQLCKDKVNTTHRDTDCMCPTCLDLPF